MKQSLSPGDTPSAAARSRELHQPYSRVMPTTSVSDDGDDDDDDVRRLTEQQRAALVNAIFTPELQRSLTAQMEPILAASRKWNEQIVENLKPLLVQITAQQRSMARSLEIPLARYAEAQSRLIMSPELTRAMARLSTASRVHLEVPDADGLDRLARLIDEGQISADTVSAAEAGLAGEVELSEAIADAAEQLVASRPRISRARARQIVLVWVWLMWTAAAATVVLQPRCSRGSPRYVRRGLCRQGGNGGWQSVRQGPPSAGGRTCGASRRGLTSPQGFGPRPGVVEGPRARRGSNTGVGLPMLIVLHPVGAGR